MNAAEMTTMPERFLTRRNFLFLTAALGGATIATACGNGQPSSAATASGAAPRPGGTLRMAFPSAPDSLDPQRTNAVPGLELSGHVFDNLTALDEHFRPVPRLATSWKAEKGGAEWVFQLRQGVKFHDGHELTADDVIATAERAQDLSLGLQAYGAFGPFASVAKDDDHTVRFVMSQPFSEMPVMLSGLWARIIPAHRVSTLGTDPVGTGPFRLKAFQPESGATLVKNPDYWMKGTPYLDGLNLVTISDSVAQQAALKGGQVDGLAQIDVETYLALRSASGVDAHSTSTGQFNILMTQTDMGPFTNPKIRQAFKYILDRRSLVPSLLLGQGEIGNDFPYPSRNPNHIDMPQYQQDIAKAKKLLSDAGLHQLTMEMYTTSERPPSNKMAVAFQQAARKANVDVTLHDVPYNTYASQVARKKPLYTTGIFQTEPTLYQTLYQMYHSNGPLNYSRAQQYPGLDAVLEDMVAELDATKRKALVKRALTTVHDYGATGIPYFINYLSANTKKVRGYSPPQYGYYVDLRSVWLSGD